QWRHDLRRQGLREARTRAGPCARPFQQPDGPARRSCGAMNLSTYWLYLGAVVLISATPGPNVLYVTTRSIRFGFGAAMIGMTGCLLALAIMLVASVAGVSAFMLAVPAAFTALKFAGAAYLVFLGIQTWRAPPIEPPVELPSEAAAPRGTVTGWA